MRDVSVVTKESASLVALDSVVCGTLLVSGGSSGV